MTTPNHERRALGVLWPGFLGTAVDGWLADALTAGLAGVVYFGQNLGGDVRALSDSIHRLRPDALIGIDEEGGSVTRLQAQTGSTLPGAAQLGAIDDLAATTATGRVLADRCAAVGVDVVLGPVADVNTDPRNPVIGVRSFGADTALVSRHVPAFVDGVHAGGLAACAKHYPGHGDTAQDSHLDLPTVHLTAEVMDAVHRPPFLAAAEAGVDAIMTAHIRVPAWGDRPATLNPAVLAGLRADGFDGVIVTDALDMAAIRESVGIGGGAVAALAAGADLLCIGNPTNPGPAMAPDQDERDFRAAFDAIVAALRDGTLSEERVAEAGARVARVAQAVRERQAAASAHQDHGRVAREAEMAQVVARAVTVRGTLRPLPDAPTTVVDVRRASTLAVDSAGAYVTHALAAGGDVVRVDAAATGDRPGVGAQAADVSARVADAAARLRAGRGILLVDRLDAASPQLPVISAILRAAPDTVVVNVGLAVGDLPGVTVVDARAASRAAAEAVRRLVVAERAASSPRPAATAATPPE